MENYLCSAANARDITPIGAEFPYVYSNSLNTLHANMGSPDIDADDTIIAMAIVISCGTNANMRGFVGSANVTAWTIPPNINFAGAGVGGHAVATGNILAHAEANIKAFGAKFTGAIARAPTYVTDLVLAQQAKRMKKANIKAYFAQYDMPNVSGVEVIRVVEALGRRMGLIRNVAGLVNAETPWMKYRLSATSTPSLCIRAMEIWGASVPNLISAQTIALINNAAAAPWDVNLARLIPGKMITLTHATLSAFKSLPEDWYYGTSHKSSCNLMLYRGFYKAAQKLATLGAGTEQMEEAKTLQELVAAIPNTLLNV